MMDMIIREVRLLSRLCGESRSALAPRSTFGLSRPASNDPELLANLQGAACEGNQNGSGKRVHREN
jgi:hypothetical protein